MDTQVTVGIVDLSARLDVQCPAAIEADTEIHAIVPLRAGAGNHCRASGTIAQKASGITDLPACLDVQRPSVYVENAVIGPLRTCADNRCRATVHIAFVITDLPA